MRGFLAALGAAFSIGVVIVMPAASSGATTAHLEYVLNDGPVSVYEIDSGFALKETFTIPETSKGVRGVAVSPVTHQMFVAYGGDGGSNGSGSVLDYDLVTKTVVWHVALTVGIDSLAVSNDGKTLYVPDGELSLDGNWNILDASTGAKTGVISTAGAGPHDGPAHLAAAEAPQQPS